MTTETNNKPFLRALKCAYKLHKAGMKADDTIGFLSWAHGVPADKLPSAAAPVEAILLGVYENSGMQQSTLVAFASQLGFDAVAHDLETLPWAP